MLAMSTGSLLGVIIWAAIKGIAGAVTASPKIFVAAIFGATISLIGFGLFAVLLSLLDPILSVVYEEWTVCIVEEVFWSKSIMSNSESKIQVQMLWPVRLLNAPPAYQVPPGYRLRTYQKGDETGFFKIMELAGWTGWDNERLKPWLYRILPQGLFMATSDATGEIVASSMATHDHTWIKPS